MATPGPVRSGIRAAGSDVPAATYAHPPLVECWLETSFGTNSALIDADFAPIIARLGPEWPQRTLPRPATTDLRFSNTMGDRALHLSAQGFGFGWLGHSGERYPRYEAVRDGFVAVLDLVRDVVQLRKGTFSLQTWSVHYLNRIPCGTVWSTADDWSFFALWRPETLKSLGVDAVGAQGRWELPLEGKRGRLTIQFRHDEVPSNGVCSVWIELTASGHVDDSESSLFDGLDFGREVIVRSFNELVSADAKAYWDVADE